MTKITAFDRLLDKPFGCDQCEERFSENKQLQEHVESHSKTPTKPFSCTPCDKGFHSKQELDNHLATHEMKTPSKYRYCSHCGLRLPENAWEQHEMSHSGAIKKQSNCKKCGKKFGNQTDLNQHEKTCPKSQVESLSAGLSAGKDKTQEQKNEDFNCQKCDQVFNSRYQLNDHTCPKTIRSLQRLAQENSSNEKPFDCQFCGIKFSRADNLKRHVETKHLEMNTLKLPTL